MQNPQPLRKLGQIEGYILGAMLVDSVGVPIALGIVKEDCFTGENRKVFSAIKTLFEKGEAIDMVSVKSVSGASLAHITELTYSIASSAHIETHCRLLYEEYISKSLATISQEVQLNIHEDCFELLDNTLVKLIDLRGGVAKDKPKHISVSSHENYKVIDRLSRGEITQLGISTGFKSLDAVIHGLIPGDKIEVAGSTSMGKSAFVLNIINNVAIEQKIPVLMFSLEMSARSQDMRLKSIRTGIDFSRLIAGNIFQDEWEKLLKQTEIISDSPLYIDDCGGLTHVELRAKAIRMKHEFKIGLIVVDYIGLMAAHDSKGKNREQVVAEISRSNKQIAQELQVPLIEVAQISREVFKTSDKRPQLHHLRESGSLEQDADIVIFPYRPEHYGIMNYEGGESTRGVAEIIIAKHRNGALKTIPMQFKGHTMLFSENPR